MSIMTLKPGLLVSLSTRMSGGVQYTRVDLNADKTEGDETAVSRWETTKIVEDPKEHDRASKVRSKCGSLVRSVCTYSSFGLLCPESKEKQLDEALAEARQLADAFNASSKTVKVSVYALKGRIAQNDDEAARAIASELKQLMTEMEEGIGAGNVTAAREAASKAKKMGAMLDEATGKKVAAAVEEAREAAREITKKMAAGEDRAAIVQNIKLDAVRAARFAFLDLEEAKAVEGQALPSAAPRAVETDEEEIERIVAAAPLDDDAEQDRLDAKNTKAAAASSRTIDWEV